MPKKKSKLENLRQKKEKQEQKEAPKQIEQAQRGVITYRREDVLVQAFYIYINGRDLNAD